MDSSYQSGGQSFLSNNTYMEEVPLFVSYLSMVVVLIPTIIVIYPSVIVIKVIWQTRELHTKYFFLVANLLATDSISMLVRFVINLVIMILYLLDLNTDGANAMLKMLVIPIYTLCIFIVAQSPVILAIERIIVIGFPYRHRSIMTTKMVIIILAVMWGLSLTMTIIITILVPVDIVWPLAKVNYSNGIIPFFWFSGLILITFITVANVFLGYKVFVSNRKARENQRLGNEEVKQYQKLVQLFRTHVKPTVTLLLVGGIDVMGAIIFSSMHTAIAVFVEPSKTIYFEHFLTSVLADCVLASRPLVYGLYLKKIRRRLPSCSAFPWPIARQCNNTCKSKVIALHQQPRITT